MALQIPQTLSFTLFALIEMHVHYFSPSKELYLIQSQHRNTCDVKIS